MEIILALVVVAAVIFFGALISYGNERQRQAIDALRERTELWAMQDLRIKREKLSRDVNVDDPLAWLNRVAGKVSGMDLSFQFLESFEDPCVLLCTSGNQGKRVLLSPFSPREIQDIKRGRKSRLSQFVKNNPLLSLPKKVSSYEISVLNAGILFDLELQQVWKEMTGHKGDQVERLWMYIV